MQRRLKLYEMINTMPTMKVLKCSLDGGGSGELEQLDEPEALRDRGGCRSGGPTPASWMKI